MSTTAAPTTALEDGGTRRARAPPDCLGGGPHERDPVGKMWGVSHVVSAAKGLHPRPPCRPPLRCCDLDFHGSSWHPWPGPRFPPMESDHPSRPPGMMTSFKTPNSSRNSFLWCVVRGGRPGCHKGTREKTQGTASWRNRKFSNVFGMYGRGMGGPSPPEKTAGASVAPSPSRESQGRSSGVAEGTGGKGSSGSFVACCHSAVGRVDQRTWQITSAGPDRSLSSRPSPGGLGGACAFQVPPPGGMV